MNKKRKLRKNAKLSHTSMLASQRSTSLSLANREGKTHAHAKISHTKLNFTVVSETSEHGGERPRNHAKSATKKIKRCAQRFDTKCTKICSSAEECSPTGHRGAPHLAGAHMGKVFELVFLLGEDLKESKSFRKAISVLQETTATSAAHNPQLRRMLLR